MSSQAATGSLFDDSQIQPDLLRRRSHIRWGSYPPDVIPLTAAEADFPGPQAVTDAVMASLADGYFPYASPEGISELREVFSDMAKTRYGISADPDCVVPASGTAAALWGVVHLLCREGDECILLDPVDLLFGQAIDAAGARRVYCPMDKTTGQLDPDRLASLISPRTALICLCNPHNPLGTVFTEETLRAIAETADAHGVPILSDEVWNEIVYPPAAHVSLAGLDAAAGRRIHTVIGLSKTFALPGLRMGFVIAPNAREAADLQLAFQQLGAAYSLTPFAQVGALAALRHGWPWRDAFLEHLHETRDYCVARLNAIPGMSCSRPDGTFVLFPDISSTGLGSQAMAEFLLTEARVAVVAGTTEWFGPGAEGNIRISYATSRGMMKEALDRMERAVASLSAGSARRAVSAVPRTHGLPPGT
ncbi:aminotransferase class I/II-fold pyridoxal phosphate-dependent enzyme [Streptomyces sp. HNM0663]|uniref:Aminotransferase n=1 Tax=Streptomyces chengmaiensis TaxID=3040919 RepID=A0ABT6HHZ1_9ACTN|nr:aminotransferase class I/II-fold pyridoxal phosphate-dependent enzyme [Streptomyces chengmaiensis]MDH2388377.1 aminotransferase class I/II-fold pyridoxal phosphate-dependent enzyme [Streptomyces chengmaiensis]